ncbi:lysine--tRNA ligase [Candidatus Bathyarchaeota archaeon]|nr:lysine--tRNA ligase [Candidatus Bathyarchaeota archaeon]MBS7630303.1 lysine--tRNA ligase [Candidatus Bathyarchaeota archaeon]
MPKEIIGKGTWYDKAAKSLIEREKSLGRTLTPIRTESGLGASGFPHIGSLGDAIRNYAVALGVKLQGYDSELVAFSDDKDGLRKVPAGLPKEYERWLGYPVSDIPDPAGDCHESFGSHMTSLLLEALDKCGVEYKFQSAAKVYELGLLNREILTILENVEKAGKIIKEELGQEKYLETLPYFPICENCGRIYTTNAYEYVPDEHKILYRCTGMEVKKKWLNGCGHEGEVDVLSGKGKLSWKVEFAARWKALDIRFEAYGKDIADSVRVNDRICREILGFEPPMHVQYEMFLDKGGKKISKSAGNVFTPQVWFRYGTPQSLNLLILKRFVGTRSCSVDDVPTHMDEFDHLEEIYFGKSGIIDELESIKLSGLYEYCWMLKPPIKPSVHIPYNLLVQLAKVAPKGSETDFIRNKLEKYGYLKQGAEGLEERIRFALNWLNDFGRITKIEVKMSEKEAEAIESISEMLQKVKTADEYQSAVFQTAKNLNMSPKNIFQILYKILLGSSQGPRFGSYVEALGSDKVIKELRKAVKKSGKK